MYLTVIFNVQPAKYKVSREMYLKKKNNFTPNFMTYQYAQRTLDYNS